MALAIIGCAASAAPSKEFSIAPPAAWVSVVPFDTNERPVVGRDSGGVRYRLTDAQVRVGASNRAMYRRLVATALNERGIESIGNIEIPFDPSYQTLTLHEVAIHRDGRTLRKLSASAVRILQREKELEYLIYDGQKTANLFVDDLRVGDTLEYAYTVSGSNPVFGGREFGRFDLQWSVPVERLHRRLVVSKDHRLTLSPRNTELAPRVVDSAHEREYVWEARDQAAQTVESEAPSWYDPYAVVQWSEFDDWAAVVRWAEPLYRLPATPAPAIRREVDRIAASARNPNERMLAALRLVQSQVRYLGVEVGPGSHAPGAPSLVLERRFGDCKDKALLTVALLRGLGIDAQPALVHTSRRRTIAELSPSPGAFNHVIVHARVGERSYWLDPTRPTQEGSADTLFQPDYGVALVVAPDRRDLTPMPPTPSRETARTVQIDIDMRQGYNQPAKMTVTSVYNGVGADRVRSMLATQRRSDVQQRYLNYYAGTYPEIRLAEPFETVDDGHANRYTLIETYWVDRAWTRNDDKRRAELILPTSELNDLLTQPKEAIRSAPLALSHPVDVTLTTNVLMPEDWNIAPDRDRVDDPTFEFEQVAQARGRHVTLTNRYVSRADHVVAADVARYTASLRKAGESHGYRLYRHDAKPEPKGNAPWTLLLAAALVAAWGALAWRLYHHDPPPASATPRGPFEMPLQGIGGWLLLPALGVILSPLRLLMTLRETASAYAGDVWMAALLPGNAESNPLRSGTMLYELAANIGLLVLYALLAVLFFRKRSNVPRFYVALIVASIAVPIIDALLMSSFLPASDQGWARIGQGLFFGALWSAYFMRSRRVRETFVERLPSRASPTMHAPPLPINPAG